MYLPDRTRHLTGPKARWGTGKRCPLVCASEKSHGGDVETRQLIKRAKAVEPIADDEPQAKAQLVSGIGDPALRSTLT
jgi:MoaA/NifB/PqqE/SkfB family radical SAM enzyme